MRRLLRIALLTLAGAFVAIQLVPYGRDHDNPPVVRDAPWPSAEARDVAVAACYDCHSNESEWPVYSWVAPVSWLVTQDVDSGRAALNFSEWGNQDEADDAADAVADREMPPRNYTLLHPDARLDDAERRLLVDALTAMAPDD